MGKLDLAKEYKSYYSAKDKPELAIIEKAQFLSISGKGDPSQKNYTEKIQALYKTAYAVKFIFKAMGKDFTVPKLEGLWWFNEEQYKGLTISDAPQRVPRSDWEYRLLLRIPDFVTRQECNNAISSLLEKMRLEKQDTGLIREVEWHQLTEGKCVQILHKGPFENEPETLAVLDAFMKVHNLQRNGVHHEIYLSDFRKTVPDKFRTILREPVK